MRNALKPTVIGLIGLTLMGCGVPLQETAEPLPANVVPPAASASPAPSESPAPSPTATETVVVTPASPVDLFFVAESGLAAVETLVEPSDDPAAVIASLAISPLDNPELRTVLIDPVTGGSMVVVLAESDPAAIEGAAVTVEVSQAFSVLPPTEQVLLIGQVVLSLASAGYFSVEFVDAQGSPVAVPLPDGRLLDRPATAADYSSLITAL
jgi:hypothetical protein